MLVGQCQWRFRAGIGGGTGPSKLWLGPPKFSRTFDAVFVNRFSEKLVNLMPPDVRF